MSAITLEYPVESLPGLPVQEGLRFFGVIRGGKAQVRVSDSTLAKTETDRRSAALESFLTKWSGKGSLLPRHEMEQDPRLAYLTAKHIH